MEEYDETYPETNGLDAGEPGDEPPGDLVVTTKNEVGEPV